jgi:hypothetical protein
MFNQLSLFGLEQEVLFLFQNQYMKKMMNCDKTILDRWEITSSNWVHMWLASVCSLEWPQGVNIEAARLGVSACLMGNTDWVQHGQHVHNVYTMIPAYETWQNVPFCWKEEL